ncbi:MAG: DUF4876 domain-containing protein [Bacteroidales bacterium]|nr:DUF4876 domain-containing protein [Bacteroidales bacterium]
MKNLLTYFVVAVFALGFSSCAQFDEIAESERVANVSAKVVVNTTLGEGVPAPETYTVKFNNYTEGFELVETTDASGIVNTESLIPGIYSITVSAEVAHNGSVYNFNGNLVNVNILNNGQSLTVDVNASKSGALVLKEIFYCGSKTPSGGSYFRDQFYEVYNNSDMVQYVDGMCIGNMLPALATANLPVWPDEFASSHVFFATIWQLPGTPGEKNYPLQPGESIIIAQMADNHQREALNPGSPVNLIGAEFEAYLQSTSLIKDNPAINMNLAFWPSPSKQWLVTVFGGAYAIFFPEAPIDRNTYITPVGQTTKAKEIPIDWIVDAVELVNDETKIKLKRVPAVLDAGATTVGGTYVNKSVCRKVKETIQNPDGSSRVKYYDTNNTSEDFYVTEIPMIHRDGAKSPSWNTWQN